MFSITAHAEDQLDTRLLKVNYRMWENSLGYEKQVNITNFSANNAYTETITISNKKKFSFGHSIIIADTQNNVIAQSGRPTTVEVNNLSWEVDYTYNGYQTTYTPEHGIADLYFQLIFLDGSTQDVSSTIEYIYNPRTGTANFSMKFTPDKDVYRMVISFKTNYDLNQNSDFANATKVNFSFVFGVKDDNNLQLNILIQSEEAGLLEGILGKLQSLWNSITDLPNKLWSLIENGLKNLFVPSEEYIVSYKDKWDELLSDRLGAVYQVVNVLTESWDGVMEADQVDSIQFPATSINLPSGNGATVTFTFGGYPVQIVPDGFDFLVTSLKVLVGVVATIAFINGLRKRYEEVMGVET